MSVEFLTNEWFDEQERIKGSIAGLEMNEKLAQLVANLIIDIGDGSTYDACYRGGFLEKGHADTAEATIHLPAKIAYNGLILGNTGQAVAAMMSGKIKLDGNKMTLMALANARPTETHKQFMSKLKEVTTI